MKELIKWIDEQPLWLKIIFALPMLDIVWSIYRICRSVAKNNVLGIVLGVILLFLGPTIVWVLDLVTLIFKLNKETVFWID
ncbi:MAG: hypothetical protein J1F31_03055 [Erysipelotrichales bacterium]|nr:hypothetical protein [Erysipelotrichales bacterium]